jgi:hypothetical protein
MLLIAGCAASPPPVDLAADLRAVASRYISLAQDLARHDPSLIDHWLTEPPTPAGARRPVFTIQRDIDGLIAESERAVLSNSGAPRARAAHLHAQLKALSLAARRLLGESPRPPSAWASMPSAPTSSRWCARAMRSKVNCPGRARSPNASRRFDAAS